MQQIDSRIAQLYDLQLLPLEVYIDYCTKFLLSEQSAIFETWSSGCEVPEFTWVRAHMYT